MLAFIATLPAFAGQRWWVSSGNSTWNNTANWSLTNGGAGGASVPGSNDTVTFNGNGTGNDTLDMNVSIKLLNIGAGYTGTIVQRTYTITLANGAALGGGTFKGGSANITSSGAVTINGTAFTSTSATMAISANFTLSSGSFTHNSGLVKFDVTCTITGSMTFKQLEFTSSSARTFTIASGTTLTVDSTLTISGTAASTFNTGTINANKDIVVSNTGASGGGGTATIVVHGSGSQSFSGASIANGVSRLPNVTINKSGGTVTLSNRLVILGNWTWSNGTVTCASSNIIGFAGTKTITGTHTLGKVIFGGSGTVTFTIASGTTLTIADSLFFKDATSMTINTGTINAQGYIKDALIGTSGGGSASFVINGGSNQTFVGNGVFGGGKLPNVTINKSGSTLTLDSIISVAGNWTYTAGTIAPGYSTVAFYGTKTISGSHTLMNVYFGGATASTYTIASGTTLTVNDTIRLGDANNITLSTGNISAHGNLYVVNTATGGGGDATITFNGNSGNQTLMGNGTAGQGRLPNIVIDKPSLYQMYFASVITVAGDWTYVQGSVDPSSSAVGFVGTHNVDGENSGVMAFNKVSFGGTTTLTGGIKVLDNLTIATSSSLSAGSYTIQLVGNWNNNGTFTAGTSTLSFFRSSYSRITRSGGTETFYNLGIDRAGSVTLYSPVTISGTLTFTEGVFKTNSTNFLNLADNATATGGSDIGYVHGPMRKTGNDAFTFPLGDTTLSSGAYHPLGITAPSSTGDQFEAKYLAQNGLTAYGSTKVDSLENVSDCEYWTLERKAGSSTVKATISWNSNLCNSDNFSDLRIAGWNGTQWNDLGADNPTLTGDLGTITTTSTVSFSLNPLPLTLSKKKVFGPCAILHKKLDGGYYQAINGKLMFRYDEEYTPNHDDLNYIIYADDHSIVSSTATNTFSIANKPKVRYGDNRYLINTASCHVGAGGYLPNGFYILEVINDKNEHWYLRFKNVSVISVNDCTTIIGGS